MRSRKNGFIKISFQNFRSYTLKLFYSNMSDVLASNPPPPADQAEELQLPLANEETEQNSEILNDNTATEGDNKKDRKKNSISDRLYEEKKKQDVYSYLL